MKAKPVFLLQQPFLIHLYVVFQNHHISLWKKFFVKLFSLHHDKYNNLNNNFKVFFEEKMEPECFKS